MKPGRVVLLSIVAAALAAPASAQAITVSGTGAPTDLTAGANSNFNIHIDFAGGQVQDLTVGLPPGVVGDPTATPKCTVAELNASTAAADGCAANTVVGEVHADAAVSGFLPVTADGFLFNLVPQPGEPARFGIVLRPLGAGLPVVPPIILQSGAALRNSDFGLDTIINDIPNTTVAAGDTTITSQDITLYGTAPGTGRTFMRNPTSCNPKSVTFRANDYADPNTFSNATAPAFTPTTCAALPFSPTFSAKITVPGFVEPDTKPIVETAIDQDPGEAGLRSAKVFVPPALAADTNEILPTEICPLPSFQAGSCPANALVGSAIATSPLLTAPLRGPVVLVDNPGGVVKIGMDLHGELSMQIQGQLGIDNTTTFTGLPDIPIAHFALTFNGGPGGLLFASTDLCKGSLPVFHTDFESHSGVPTQADTPATVAGCGPPRSPSASIRLKRAKSKNPKLVLVASAASRFAALTGVELRLPKGLAFAKGRVFNRPLRRGGVTPKGAKMTHSRRKLKLQVARGAPSVRVRIAKGALRRTGRLPKRKRVFPVTLRDADGATTAVTVRP